MAARKVFHPKSPLRLAMKKANKEVLQAYNFEREAVGQRHISQGCLRKRGGPRRYGPRIAYARLLDELRSM